MDLKDTTVMVTGGAARIGREICKVLAEQGCNIVIHYNQSEDQAEALSTELLQIGVKVCTVKGDLSIKDEANKVFADAWAKADGVDALINNAAVFYKNIDRDSKDAEYQMQVNYHSPVALIRSLVDKGSHAKVVNILDRRIVSEDVTCEAYVESKKLLADYTSEAALKYAPGMTVNAVAPGAIMVPENIHDKAGCIPLGNGNKGTPRDVANAVVFLLESDAVTGQVVFVDGGQHLQADKGEG